MEDYQQEPKKNKEQIKSQDNDEIKINYEKQEVKKQQPATPERWTSEKSDVKGNTGISDLNIISLDQGRLLIKSTFKDTKFSESILDPTAKTISLGKDIPPINCSNMTDKQMLYTAHLCNTFQHFWKPLSPWGAGDLIAKDNNGKEIDYEGKNEIPTNGCSLVFLGQPVADISTPLDAKPRDFLSIAEFKKNYSFLIQNPGFKSFMTAINKWINTNTNSFGF